MKSRRIVLSALMALAVLLLFPAAAQAGLGVSTGKVYIDDLYPGSSRMVWVTLNNTGGQPLSLNAVPARPDNTQAGYEPLPYLEWVSCSPALFTIPAGGQTSVTITVAMPADSAYTGKQAEVRVEFAVQGDSVPLQTESLLITTRGASVGGARPGDLEGVGISAELSPNRWDSLLFWTALMLVGVGVAAGWIVIQRKNTLRRGL